MTPLLFPCAAEGIAREAAHLAAGRPMVMLWQAQNRALAVPANWERKTCFAAAQAAAKAAGWPLVARSSGGGGVPQGPGTVNLTLVLPVPEGFHIRAGYHLICAAMMEALLRFDLPTATGPVAGSFCDGDWNLVTACGHKLAGTAQRWRSTSDNSRIALIHAALLIEQPSPDLWPLLETVHATLGLPGEFQAERHIGLKELLPGMIRLEAIYGALVRAAEDRLAGLIPKRRQAA